MVYLGTIFLIWASLHCSVLMKEFFFEQNRLYFLSLCNHFLSIPIYLRILCAFFCLIVFFCSNCAHFQLKMMKIHLATVQNTSECVAWVDVRDDGRKKRRKRDEKHIQARLTEQDSTWKVFNVNCLIRSAALNKCTFPYKNKQKLEHELKKNRIHIKWTSRGRKPRPKTMKIEAKKRRVAKLKLKAQHGFVLYFFAAAVAVSSMNHCHFEHFLALSIRLT